jgi:putative transposase
MAAINQNIKEGLIFHSDRGGQYAAEIFINILYSYKKKTLSVSAAEQWLDFSLSEIFLKSLKNELIYRTNETVNHSLY